MQHVQQLRVCLGCRCGHIDHWISTHSLLFLQLRLRLLCLLLLLLPLLCLRLRRLLRFACYLPQHHRLMRRLWLHQLLLALLLPLRLQPALANCVLLLLCWLQRLLLCLL